VDLLWSVNLPKNLAFEYGLGVGAGVLFGDLVINWVYDDPNGPFEGSNGKRYQTCRTQADGVGCRVQDHENASTARVGGYAEPSWVNGGAKPNFLPHLSLPQVGLRFQPMREVQGRIGVGWSLTGFWFGVGIHYGLPSGQKP
jgi:hypothetical protein